MSEYQYYEFQAIDTPLSAEEQKEIAKLSSRVELTPRQAIFVYNYGDFRGDPKKILARYFDALLYVTNFGTRQLMFRFPKALVSKDSIAPYCLRHIVSISSTEDHLILDICFNNEEWGSWTDAEGWLPPLLPLRKDVIDGDYRLLYLAWLYSLRDHNDDTSPRKEKEAEPPIPSGLNNLSEPLEHFIKLFGVDRYLVRAAALSSSSLIKREDQRFDELIPRLSEEERNSFLAQLLHGEMHLDVKLKKRLLQLVNGECIHESNASRRSVSELLQLSKKMAVEEREREQQKELKCREEKLAKLKQQEPDVLKDIFSLIETKQTKSYQRAVELLSDLRELAERSGSKETFQNQVEEIHRHYSRLSSLRQQMRQAGL